MINHYSERKERYGLCLEMAMKKVLRTPLSEISSTGEIEQSFRLD